MSKEKEDNYPDQGIVGRPILSNVFSVAQGVSMDYALRRLNIGWEHYSNFKSLYDMVGIRLKELDAVSGILANSAQRKALMSNYFKVSLVILGALVATKGALSQFIDISSAINILLYTVIGLLITSLAGIEAIFKWESKSTELKLLAATCRTTKRQFSSQTTEVIAIEGDDQKLEAMKKLLDNLDVKLSEIQEKAANLGTNIVFEIQSRYKA